MSDSKKDVESKDDVEVEAVAVVKEKKPRKKREKKVVDPSAAPKVKRAPIEYNLFVKEQYQSAAIKEIKSTTKLIG